MNAESEAEKVKVPALLRRSHVRGIGTLPVMRPQLSSPVAQRLAPHGAPARQLDLALQVKEAGVLPKELLQGACALPPWQSQWQHSAVISNQPPIDI